MGYQPEQISYTILPNKETKGQRPLDELTEILQQKVPVALANPIIALDAFINFGYLLSGQDVTPSFSPASVILPFGKIEQLSSDEFMSLKKELSSLITTRFTTVPTELFERCRLDSPTNILQHESDHIMALPEDVRSTAKVVLAFLKDNAAATTSGDIMATVLTQGVGDKELLQSLLAPEVVSIIDIANARMLAISIGDKKLIEEVEHIISQKRLEE